MIARLTQKLTIPELRRLISRLQSRLTPTAVFIWHWSRWRRQHQIVAAIAHRKTWQHVQL